MRNFSRSEKINIIDPGGGTGDTAAGKDELCAICSVERQVMVKSFACKWGVDVATVFFINCSPKSVCWDGHTLLRIINKETKLLVGVAGLVILTYPHNVFEYLNSNKIVAFAKIPRSWTIYSTQDLDKNNCCFLLCVTPLVSYTSRQLTDRHLQRLLLSSTYFSISEFLILSSLNIVCLSLQFFQFSFLKLKKNRKPIHAMFVL